MDEKDLQYLKQKWGKSPISHLANKYNMSQIELISTLRKHNIVTDIQPIELQYISENIDTMPASEIQNALSLSGSQFSQILEKNLGKKRRNSVTDLSDDVVGKRTRWLIEEKLQWPIDDDLPREITEEIFTGNDLYDCIKFARSAKKKDPHYKYFPAVAYLICKAYPNTFRPFQFRHNKDKTYFKGKGGRKNLITAAKWILEVKMGYKPEFLAASSQNRYFLKSRDLSFYGIAPTQFKTQFDTHKEFVTAILKSYQEYQANSKNVRANTSQLRQTLIKAGRILEGCECLDCNFSEFEVDIHHIIPVAEASQFKFDINQAENLVILCPNHHRIAHSFNRQELDLKKPETWLDKVLTYIAEQENNSKA